jgi:hypothetical protein
VAEAHPRFYVAPTVEHQHLVDLPEINPLDGYEAIQGKRIYLAASEGIGDEVMYSWAWGPAIEQLDVALVVDCDRRLVRPYRRSFPGIVAHPYDRRVDSDLATQRARWLPDGVDCWMGQREFFRFIRGSEERPDDIGVRQAGGWLKPDPARVAHYREQMMPGALNVALSWGNPVALPDRAKHFPPMREWKKLIEVDKRVTWWTVQHYVAEGGAMPADAHKMAGLDVTDDIEGVLALMAACDLVVAPANTPCWLGAAVGRTVLTPRSFPARMGSLTEEHIPGFPMIQPAWRNRMGEKPDDAPWGAAMKAIREDIKRRVALRKV